MEGYIKNPQQIPSPIPDIMKKSKRKESAVPEQSVSRAETI
jgi:hypothetical protein